MDTDKNIVVASFYKFVPLKDYQELRSPLLDLSRKHKLRGTILLAEEGINATVAGTRKGIDTLMEFLSSDLRFNHMEYKESSNTDAPFYRMKVKLKKEIVALGVPGIQPDVKTGVHVSPQEWNELINDPEVYVIDVRNRYECEIGSFVNAVSPETETFRDFPEFVSHRLDPHKQKKVAMYCTGGIRCEKASAYMLEQGFENVYQLQGGILRYLENIKPEQNLWQGECFVFDGRVAVNDKLARGSHELCYSCRHPVTAEDKKSNKYREGISCPGCHDELSPERRARLEERQRQVTLARQRKQQHIGVPQSRHRDPSV